MVSASNNGELCEEKVSDASGGAMRRGASTERTCAAAASGLLSQCGGARLRRRTDLAMRPLGAAVVRAGVGRRWPHTLLDGPLPWADAGLLDPAATRKGRGLVMSARSIKATAVEEQEPMGTMQRTAQRLALVGIWVVASACGTCAAAACGTRRRGGGARLRRRTDLARRPPRAAVARAGVGRRWPHKPFGEPAPWAGGVLL